MNEKIQPQSRSESNIEAPRWILVGAFAESLINFRGALLEALVANVGAGSAASEPASEDVVARLKAKQVQHHAYPVARSGLDPIADLKTLRALRSLYRDTQLTHVLAYTIKPVIWSGFALRGNKRVRYTALITGLGFVFEGGSLFRKMIRALVSLLYKVALKRADAVVFQNIDNRETFVQRGLVAAEKTYVVNGSGVDLSHYTCCSLPGQPAIKFLLIARLLGEKGLREYVAAARELRAAGYDAQLILAGPADPSPDGIPLEEVQGWHAEGLVDYRGAVQDVRPLLAECDVYVLPSYHEGMPRTVLEAMAMGRPILTTDVSGCRETVLAGENGWLVAKADAKALCERMIWCMEHRDKLAAMGERSRQIAEERFDVHKVNKDMVRIMMGQPLGGLNS